MSSGQKALFYILSFIIPIVGIILGIIWLNDQDLEKNQVGKNCLIIGIIAMVLACICSFVAPFLFSIPAFMTG